MTRRTAILLAAAAAACSMAPPRTPKSEGERTYLAKCSACHRVYEPSEKTPQQWEDAVTKMEREKRVRLSVDERAQILGYLTGKAP